MTLLQRYILKEVVPQFFVVFVVFCSVVVVSQLLRLSELLATFGLTVENIFLPFFYIILSFISVILPMALLFSVVLGFARINADGEYAALLASGVPLRRVVTPVLGFAAVVYIASAVSSMHFEAWGRRELTGFLFRKSKTELDSVIKYKFQSGVFVEDFLGFVLYAENIADDRIHLKNVILSPNSKDANESFTLMAPAGTLQGAVETGDLRLTLKNGVASSMGSITSSDKTSILKFQSMEIDIMRLFKAQILGSESQSQDFRSMTPAELLAFIADLEAEPERDESMIRRSKYLYHSRIGSPFSIFAFALLGAVFGISDTRHSKNTAFGLSIITLVGAYVVLIGFKWLAENGLLNAVAASWAPGVVLWFVAMFLFYQRNRLPPSEGILLPKNIPLLNRWHRRRPRI